MNLSIITSFVVGGLLLLSILHMNFTVSNDSMQTTVQMVSKNRLQAVTQTLTADLQRMGFGVPPGDPVINSMSAEKISFQANLDGTERTIIWEFRNTSHYTASTNPNDYELVRTGPISAGSVQSITYPVVSFKLTYYDIQDNETNSPADVDYIKASVVVESPDAVSNVQGVQTYGRSFWQQTIVPPSLHIRKLNN